MGQSESVPASTSQTTESNGVARVDVDTPPPSHAGAHAGTHFSSSGPKPAARGGFNEEAQRSPSDQAFEDPEPHWEKVARRYNGAHPDHVAQFNTSTNSSCVVDGALDIPSVVAFQRRHGLRADGMIGPHTINAAHHASRAPAPGAHHAPPHAQVATAATPQHGVGHPSAEGRAVADQLFRDVNGGPGEASPTAPDGAPVAHARAPAPAPTPTASPTPEAGPAAGLGHPSAQGSAEAMKLFREVNGGPGEASPTGPDGAPIAQSAPAAAPKTVGAPSAEGSAEAMKLFREVNGGPGEASPTTPSGAPIASAQTAAPIGAAPKTVGVPSAEGSAEAMKLFREVNGGPGQPAPAPTSASINAAANTPTVGTPSPEGRAAAMQLFQDVNGAPGQPSPMTASGAPAATALAAPVPASASPSPLSTASASPSPLSTASPSPQSTASPSPLSTSATPAPPAPTALAPAPSDPPANVPSVPEGPAPRSTTPEAAAKPATEPEATTKPATTPEAATQHAAAPTGGAPQPWNQANADGQFTGAHELHIEQVSRGQVYDAISHIAPAYSHDFKVMMVGHSWIEQHGKAINNNYMGIEFANPDKPGNQAYTFVRTSTILTRAQYDANPSKYKDWTVGPSDRNTIQQQLDRNEPNIYCTEMRNRPAYQNLDDASVAFVHQVQRRIEALQGSAKAEHQKLAADALGGDAHAYAEVMTLRDRSIGLAPYNPDRGYPARMLVGITEARADATLTAKP